eukprot:8769103-Lingulodinium_polyedra.AAC.1
MPRRATRRSRPCCLPVPAPPRRWRPRSVGPRGCWRSDRGSSGPEAAQPLGRAGQRSPKWPSCSAR